MFHYKFWTFYDPSWPSATPWHSALSQMLTLSLDMSNPHVFFSQVIQRSSDLLSLKQMPTLKPITHKGNLIQTTAASYASRVLCKPKSYHMAKIQLLWEKQDRITQIMKGCTIYIFPTENILSLLSFSNPENRNIFSKYIYQFNTAVRVLFWRDFFMNIHLSPLSVHSVFQRYHFLII